MKKALSILLYLEAMPAQATTWHVGPAQSYTFCSQVAQLVQDGDTVEIDAAVYVNDPQVQWVNDNLYLLGVGGRPRLEAGSLITQDSVNGKGIFVISGDNVTVENIEFALAAVPDHNGAGIRQEGANLTVSRCRFDGNEMGILGGNIPNCKTLIEYSEFINGGSALNPGYQHNIYINHIDTFVFRFNYSHDAIAEGHELKSRASNNFILYNRIANELSVDSRTIDLPNGGTSVLVGNVIEQGPNSANSNLLGYGLEGLSNPAPHNLWVCSNTFVNKKPTGSFIQVANGTDTLFVKNNILAGAHTGGVINGTPLLFDSSHNLLDVSLASIGFVDPAGYDYHLLPGSVARDNGLSLSQSVFGYALQPQLMYVDTCLFEIRTSLGVVDIGAFEYVLPTGIPEQEDMPFVIYPVPAEEVLKILYGKEANYRVYTFTGQCVLTGKGKIVPVSELEAGLYILETGNQKTVFMKK